MTTLVLDMGDQLYTCDSVATAVSVIRECQEARRLRPTCVYGPIEMFLALTSAVDEPPAPRDSTEDRSALARWKSEGDYGDWLWIEEAEDRISRPDVQRWLTYGGFKKPT
jgi:hypothetical protein